MTGRLKHFFQNESFILWAMFFAYVAFTITSFSFYEPWRDEADSWLIAQDMSVLQMFHQLQFAGHQALWYLILMPFAKAGLPYVTLHIVHFAIIYSAVLIFLFRAPFPKLTKLFFLFSFFISFEYAIVARNYAISLLLLFLIATYFPRRFDKPLLYSFLVFLLFNTNVIVFAGAGLFMGEFFWEVIRKKGLRHPKAILSIFFMLLGMAIAIYHLYPTSPDAAGEYKGLIKIAMPSNFFLALINSMLAGVGYRMVVFFLLLAFLIFSLFMHLLSKDKKILLFISGLMLWLFYMFSFNYGGFLRHHTFILIFIIIAYWLTSYTEGKTLSRQDRKHFVFLLTALLAYSTFVSFTRHFESIIETTSGSKKVAEYIIKNGHVNDTIIADRSEYSTSILPHLREVVPGKKIWFAYKKDFGSNGPFDAGFWKVYPVKEIMANSLTFARTLPKDKVLIILHYPLQNPDSYGVKEIFVARSVILPTWNQYLRRSESYWVYALK